MEARLPCRFQIFCSSAVRSTVLTRTTLQPISPATLALSTGECQLRSGNGKPFNLRTRDIQNGKVEFPAAA